MKDNVISWGRMFLAVPLLGIAFLLSSCKSAKPPIEQMNDYKQSRMDLQKKLYSGTFADRYMITPEDEKLLTREFVLETFGAPSYKAKSNEGTIYYYYYGSKELSNCPMATMLKLKNGVWIDSTKYYHSGLLTTIEEFKKDLEKYSQKDDNGKAFLLKSLNHYVASGLLVISEKDIRKFIGEPLFGFNADNGRWLVYGYKFDNQKKLLLLEFDVENELIQVITGIDRETLKETIKGMNRLN